MISKKGLINFSIYSMFALSLGWSLPAQASIYSIRAKAANTNIATDDSAIKSQGQNELVDDGQNQIQPKKYKPLKPDEEIKSPLGCKDMGYKFELNIVRFLPEEVGERNSLYFVFNKHSKPLKLYQMRDNESARSMYLNHTIAPYHWAVLSTAEQKLNYICTTEDAKSSYGKIVNCSDNIKVCEYINVKFGLNTRGDYWLVKSNSKGGAIREVLDYGIIPR